MRKKIWITIVVVIVALGSFSMILFLNIPKPTPTSYSYELQNAFPNLTFSYPVGIYDPNDGTNRLFVVEKTGMIKVFENSYNVSKVSIFLDITANVSTSLEQGLLGLAFHPNYSSNGYFYIDYTDTLGNTIISRFKVNNTNPNKANQSSGLELLKVIQPYSYHNGGQLAFGPDGFLYIALGDGGGGGDPNLNGQNRKTLLGSILRIDVDTGSPYSIPSDNPFYNNTNGYAQEIYAFGFRNPWRFSFDTVTGDLWAGDVGESTWEEIDIVENGHNYGWNTMEGDHPFDPGTNSTSMTNPIYEYNHSLGSAIIGGFVYRGSLLTTLIGKYIYGDYGSGRIWALEYLNGTLVNNVLLYKAPFNLLSFGVDSNNQLYIGAKDGVIYHLIKIVI